MAEEITTVTITGTITRAVETTEATVVTTEAKVVTEMYFTATIGMMSRRSRPPISSSITRGGSQVSAVDVSSFLQPKVEKAAVEEAKVVPPAGSIQDAP